MMVLDTINLEEVGRDEGEGIYENLCGDSALDDSIGVTYSFWVGLLLDAISKNQEMRWGYSEHCVRTSWLIVCGWRIVYTP